MFIYQSKVNLDEKILLEGMFGNKNSTFHRPFSYSEKNQNRTVFCYILSNFRICTIPIEALTPLDRTSCIKMYNKNNARSCLFCRIAKRSILVHDLPSIEVGFSISNWQCKLQCHTNHGPEWNVEFSIPIQAPYKHFLLLLGLKDV